MIGTPFAVEESTAVEVLNNLGDFTLIFNDPPWSSIQQHVPLPKRLVKAWDMELSGLERISSEGCPGDYVVGLGGGTALDTAKFFAWKYGRPLVQIPTITSVDAGFTDAVGIREDGKVKYIGKVTPKKVVLDLDLIRSAPLRLNRAGMGDILSCHTGLFDWRIASIDNRGHAWDESLASLGEILLQGLFENEDEVHNASETGVRFLADSYRIIGAACAFAGHSRFEEGSEHFWAYTYEHQTGAHLAHGEIISFTTVLMSFLQENHPKRIREFVSRCEVRANPIDLGITRDQFDAVFVELRNYVRNEKLDYSIIDKSVFSQSQIGDAWDFVNEIPVLENGV